MKVFQVLLVFGVLGLALWGLVQLSSAVSQKPDDLESLAKSLGSGSGRSTEGAGESASGENGEEKAKDYYAVNPFKMPSGGEQLPKAVMPETTHDFDRMAMGQKGTHDFILKNEGSVPLKVAKGPTMCKCTLSSVKDQEVPPGGEITISVEYEPKSLGPFSQTAVVWTNDPESPKIEMLIVGKMFAEVATNPESGWHLGSVPTGAEKEFTGYVYSSVQKDLEIVEYKSSSDQVVVQVEEVPPGEAIVLEEDSMDEILKAYRITGKVLGSEVLGTLKETITIKTNNEIMKEVTLPVQVARTGPLIVISKGWYAEKHLLQLGRIPSSEGKTQKLTLLIDAFDQELELSNIDTGLPFISLKMTRESTPPEATKHRYAVELEIAKNAPLGEWTGPKAVTISFDTNHPKVPHFEIHADFEIL